MLELTRRQPPKGLCTWTFSRGRGVRGTLGLGASKSVDRTRRHTHTHTHTHLGPHYSQTRNKKNVPGTTVGKDSV